MTCALHVGDVRDRFVYRDGVLYWRTARVAARVGTRAGTLHTSGRRYVTYNGRRVLEHRLVWVWCTGAAPPVEIDHINGDPGDNRIENLRPADRFLNTQNLRRAKHQNQTGVLGVTPSGRGFMAQITAHGVYHYLGTHDTPDEAHQAYLDAKRRLHEGNTL